MRGSCAASARGSRASPPVVVSPLTLAFASLESVTCLSQALRQQVHPALIDGDAVAGAEAVAVHQYHRLTDWRSVCRCAEDRNEQSTAGRQ